MVCLLKILVHNVTPWMSTIFLAQLKGHLYYCTSPNTENKKHIQMYVLVCVRGISVESDVCLLLLLRVTTKGQIPIRCWNNWMTSSFQLRLWTTNGLLKSLLVRQDVGFQKSGHISYTVTWIFQYLLSKFWITFSPKLKQTCELSIMNVEGSIPIRTRNDHQ